MRGTNDKNSKVGQRGLGRGPMTYFYNISGMVQARNLKFGTRVHIHDDQ